jgi:hypothetical protein
MNDAALKMKKLKEEVASAGKRVPQNAYTKILSDTSERYDLPDVLDYKSVESRLRPGRKVLAANPGPVSPMVSLEVHVVDWILQRASMRQPVTPKMALQLINSMVEGTEVQEKVCEWKKKHLKEHKINKDGPTLGQKYWLNLMKRHPQLKSKNALHFDSLRDDWCTAENIGQIYDQIYEAMVHSNVAIKLDDPV